VPTHPRGAPAVGQRSLLVKLLFHKRAHSCITTPESGRSGVLDPSFRGSAEERPPSARNPKADFSHRGTHPPRDRGPGPRALSKGTGKPVPFAFSGQPIAWNTPVSIKPIPGGVTADTHHGTDGHLPGVQVPGWPPPGRPGRRHSTDTSMQRSRCFFRAGVTFFALKATITLEGWAGPGRNLGEVPTSKVCRDKRQAESRPQLLLVFLKL
jgi:hypothetical protein